MMVVTKLLMPALASRETSYTMPPMSRKGRVGGSL